MLTVKKKKLKNPIQPRMALYGRLSELHSLMMMVCHCTKATILLKKLFERFTASDHDSYCGRLTVLRFVEPLP